MASKVKLEGRGISEETARSIISLAKRAKSIKDCPYRKGWVQWSVWVTAFRHKGATNDQLYRAMLRQGVPCNVKQRSSSDYPGLLPFKGTVHNRRPHESQSVDGNR